MQPTEKKPFLEMLTDTLASYGKPLPEGALLAAWWSNLEPFPLRIVAMAFSEYRAENGEFPPVPAGIAKRCKLMDGRPGAEEAWAIALTSRDEADTVVWTAETAEAFAICSPIFPDEVGARMAFKEAYSRLVAAARLTGKPSVWSVSLGWDVQKREAVIERAHVAGLLAAPAVRALLPNYSGAAAAPGAECPEGLKKVKEALAQIQDGWAKAAENRAAEVAAEREAEAARKAEIAGQVAAYQQNVIPLKAQA
jgi:hypothetical protein